MSIKVSSRDQSGGVTAHTVNVGSSAGAGAPAAAPSEPSRSIWLKVGGWAIGAITLVAAVFGILDYLGYHPWKH